MCVGCRYVELCIVDLFKFFIRSIDRPLHCSSNGHPFEIDYPYTETLCVCVWHSIFWARRRCGCEGYKKEAIGKRDTTFTTRFADDLTELCVPVFALFCCCCSLQIRCDAASPSSHSMGLTIMSCVRMVISISLLCSYQL